MSNFVKPHKIKVLAYHRIVDDYSLSKSQWMCVHKNEFYNHLKLIEKLGYTCITLEDYWLYLVGELQLPRKPIILTFDDGYEEIYTLARPMLQEFGMRAVLFVLGNRELKRNEWDIKEGYPEARLLNDEQIIELYQEGFEIGAHTLNHVSLSNVSEASAWKEISKAKESLEHLVDGRIYSFSYPYGAETKGVRDMVAQSGFFFGCSIFTGPPQFARDPLQIRRLTIAGGSLGLGLRLTVPYQYAEWGWSKLRMEYLSKKSNGYQEVRTDFDQQKAAESH